MNKQIEEMAKDIAIQRGYGCNEQDHCDMSCQVFKVGCMPHEDAQILYNAGYRKQSEGEWKRVKVDLGDGIEKYGFACTNCGFRNTLNVNYCPNCGAKMFVRMTHTCPHNIPNLIPTVEILFQPLKK